MNLAGRFLSLESMLYWALFGFALCLWGSNGIKHRKALFTAFESGKYVRMSGSIITAPAFGFTSLTTVVPSAL
jgi:hypothetical protein